MSTNAGTRIERFQLSMISMLEWFASLLFSTHGKRVMFISSLYVQVTQLDRLKSDVIQKLNAVMGLATREEALHFPAAISNIVWRGTEVNSVLTRELMDQSMGAERARELARRVVELCPRFMRYEPERMRTDVANLIMNGRSLRAAAQAA